MMLSSLSLWGGQAGFGTGVPQLVVGWQKIPFIVKRLKESFFFGEGGNISSEKRRRWKAGRRCLGASSAGAGVQVESQENSFGQGGQAGGFLGHRRSDVQLGTAIKNKLWWLFCKQEQEQSLWL